MVMKIENIHRYLKRAGFCPPQARSIARDRISQIDSEIRQLQDELKDLQAWLTFHDRPNKPTEYADGGYRLFRIEDGETHWVSHTSKDEAVTFHWKDVLGYKTLADYESDMGGYEVSEVAPDVGLMVREEYNGEWVVKTAAEWCKQYGLIASTCI